MHKGIRNALLMGRGYLRFGSNHPHTENDQTPYYSENTRKFYLDNLQWSANMVEAQVQGLDYSDFYAYTTVRIRTAMLIDPTTGQNLGSDWQRIIIENPEYNFIPRGAKVVFNGNTWLVTNPMNILPEMGTTIIKRCNVTWFHQDWYGNILAEPFCFGQGGNNLATANNVKINMILLDAYQHSFMQLNPETEELAHNRRIMLGKQIYVVRGLQNFVQEFSEDYDSIHLQFFDFSQDEPLNELDDIENHVADGKSLVWSIGIGGNENMLVGGTQTLTATAIRNGIVQANGVADGIMQSTASVSVDGVLSVSDDDTPSTTLTLDQSNLNATDAANVLSADLAVDDDLLLTATGEESVEHPITYSWSSSDESVATVDEFGTVTGVSAGTALITCILNENNDIASTTEITVAESETGETLTWFAEPPETLKRYNSVTLQAVYTVDGVVQEDPEITYSCSGALERSYTAEISGDTLTLTCWETSDAPLTITATYGNLTLEAEIVLQRG